MEMFNLSDEDVHLWKNTHAALVHPMEVEENSENWICQKYGVLFWVRKITAKEPLPAALRKLRKRLSMI